MYKGRERNMYVELNNMKNDKTRKPDDIKTKTITSVIIVILMLVSAAGPAGVLVLFILGIFAFIMGVMYFVFKSQVVDGTKPAGTVKDIKFDIMRTIREKSEKEGDPMFTEARAHQKRNLTKADYERFDRCSHKECLKSLLDAGIIDRSEYVERIQKLNCSTTH